MNPIYQNNARSAILSNQNLLRLISLLKGQNIECVIQQLCNTNPQFKEFYEQNKNKTIEQIASDYGVDMNLIRQLLK